jgi:SAM-dependent methyltransferase
VDGGVLLSAGCAGKWYFDWLDDCAGPFERHIGVELYSPRPDGLPANVTWIAESSSHMSTVDDGSVDVVFSGQNLEHLWIDDVAGFLLEAHRVLRPNGTLVIDSPNRIAVEALGWVQPEHTIEISVAEATQLLELAGFRVEVVRALWNCRNRATGEWLPLIAPAGEVREILDRAVTRADIDDTFVWWIEARRTDTAGDANEVVRCVRELFELHWERRVNRGAYCVGWRDADGSWVVDGGSTGVIFRSQGFPLFEGTFGVSATDPQLTVRVLRSDGTELALGSGVAEGRTDRAEFGVVAELIADSPLTAPVVGVAISVEMG